MSLDYNLAKIMTLKLNILNVILMMIIVIILFDISLFTSYDNLQENERQNLGSIFTIEQGNIMKLMKLVEDMGCLDDAIKNTNLGRRSFFNWIQI